MALSARLLALAGGVDGDDAPFYQTFSEIKAIVHAAAPAGATPFLDVLDPVSDPSDYKHAATRQGSLDACVALVAHKLGLSQPAVGEKRAVLAAVCVTLAATGMVPEGINIDELMSA